METLTLKTWITNLSDVSKTIIIDGINVVTPEMWTESAIKWGNRETTLLDDEMTDLWLVWKLNHSLSWKRIYDALNADYSPIENVDRHEMITETTTHTGTDNRTLASTHGKSGSDTLARTGTDTLKTTLDSTVKTETSNTHKINAFNGDNPTVDNMDEGLNNSKTSGGDTSLNTKDLQDVTTYNSTDSENGSDNRTVNLTDTFTHQNHTHGNIGVTENTTLITHEIEMRQKYYMYKVTVEDFLLNFFF